MMRHGGRLKNTYGRLFLSVLELSFQNKTSIFQHMGKIFCAEFQRVPYIEIFVFIQRRNFKSSYKIQELFARSMIKALKLAISYLVFLFLSVMYL